MVSAIKLNSLILKKLFCISFAYFLVSYAAISQENSIVNRFSIACHNCFEPQYASNIEDILPFTTSIEIDIWDSEVASGILTKIFGGRRMDRNWFVKHEPQKRGNLNCCGGTFKDCLTRIKNWTIQNPDHDLITIFIDKKENWSEPDETRRPAELDQFILSIFSSEKIFTPKILLNNKANLKDAAFNGNWPPLDSLKSKIMFVITNATIVTSRNPLNEYLDSQENDAVCFVAPEVRTINEISHPIGITDKNSANIVLYNLKYTNRKLSNNIHEINCLSRVYGSPETKDVYQDLQFNKVNYIAFYNYRFAKDL